MGNLANSHAHSRNMPPMPLRCQAPFTTGFGRSCSAHFFTGDESLLTGIRCAACIPLANACRTRASRLTRTHGISLDDKLEMTTCHTTNADAKSQTSNRQVPRGKCKCALRFCHVRLRQHKSTNRSDEQSCDIALETHAGVTPR